VTRSNWECTVEKSRSQMSDVRGQRLFASGQEYEVAGRLRPESRRDEMFIDKGGVQFVEAPLGAKDFRSSGAFDSFLKSDSINISPLCGDATDSARPDLRLGLLCVKGLREEAGRAIVRARAERPFTSIDDLHLRVPELRKDELRKLAAVGAFNFIKQGVRCGVSGVATRIKDDGSDKSGRSPKQGVYPANVTLTGDPDSREGAKPQRTAKSFPSPGLPPALNTLPPTPHRRDALWQVERASREPGPLYEKLEETGGSPLQAMTVNERLNADLRGTGITIGRHPMAYQRAWLDTMQVIPAVHLKNLRNGNRVKVAGWVIVRQRPGTAKGFVFLSLEDETGISNIIVTPQLFETNRLALVEYPFLLIEGILQHQDNVISVKARRIEPLEMKIDSPASHDFH